MAAAVIASPMLLAGTPTAAPVRISPNDLVGTWDTVEGDCNHGQHLFSIDGKYKVWCFNSVAEGEWSLRNGNKVIVTLDPKTTPRRSSQLYVSNDILIIQS
jgi:hypothetical protein